MGRPELCRHCARPTKADPHYNGGRGLCRTCYRKPAICRLYRTLAPKRQWTGLERLHVIQLRAAGATFIRCGELLGRTPNQVRSAWKRWNRPTRMVRPIPETRRLMTRLVRAGWLDAEIARELGLTVKTVTRYRWDFHLRVNREKSDALVRCFGCDRPCPAGTMVAKAGWSRRVVPTNGVPVLEIQCPGCSAETGVAS